MSTQPTPAEKPWIIDADGHIVEPEACFTDFLDPRYRSYVPRVVAYDDHFRYACGDELGFRIHADPTTVGAPGRTTLDTSVDGAIAGAAPVVVANGGNDPTARLADLDIEGIATAVLYPTYGLMIQGVREREPALALCRAINDWLADYCTLDRDRLVGIGTLPMTHPDDALAEAKRCIEQLGFRGVWRRPERIVGLPAVHDPGYDQLWSYLADAGLPIAIHPGLNGAVPDPYLRDRFDDDFTTMHAVHFPAEQIMNVTSFIGFGILERHPQLKVAFLECGAGWVPYYLHRLDEHLEVFGYRNAKLSMRPSDYFRRQCFVSVEEAEPVLDAVLAAYPDSVVFASDYPHGDGTFPGATKELLDTDALDDAQRRAVLRDNARRLYSI